MAQSPLKRPKISVPERAGSLPGAPNQSVPARPGVPYALNADLRTEYVSGGGVQWLANYARTLSWDIDDITVGFGDDLYDRMLMGDAVVSGTMSALKTAVLEDGITLQSSVQDRDKDGYALADELTTFCFSALEEMETSFDDALWSLLDAMAYGNKVAEQVYAYDSTYTGKNQLVLRALKVKPRHSTAFVVDVYNNVIGLMGLVPGVASPVLTGTMLTDPKDAPNLLPREKFAVLTFRPKDSDPRGTSILRPAFHSWWQKQQLAPQYLKYLTQFASPSLVGTGPENAPAMPQVDANGNIVTDVNGNPVMIQPLTALGTALATFQNGSYIVVPYGANVTALEMAGDGSPFAQAFARFDREIVLAILNQTLATGEGEHQARAAAAVHQDILDTVIRQAKHSVGRMVRKDILQRLVRYNYGPEAVRLTPQVSMGRIEERDLASATNAIAQLAASYPLAEDQLPQIDAQLKLPVRSGSGKIVTGASAEKPPATGGAKPQTK